MSDDLSDLDALLSGGDEDFSLINPEIVAAADHISEVFLGAGAGALGTSIAKGVHYANTTSRFCQPVVGLNGEASDVFVVSKISWTGDNEGELYLMLPEMAAKSLVAFFMAMAMGTEPDPEGTLLDEEGMDAYSELISTVLGQGSQALRGDPGGDVNLSIVEHSTCNFGETPVDQMLGEEEWLCTTGQLSIEGVMPYAVRLFMPVPVTGMELVENRPDADVVDQAVSGVIAEEEGDLPNAPLASKLCLPVVVVLAEKKIRLESIEEYKPGSIIEFKKLSGERLDVCAGKTKFGEGEVVIVNQHFGIQIQKLFGKPAV